MKTTFVLFCFYQPLEIITGSAQSNGFHGAQGAASIVPLLYCALARGRLYQIAMSGRACGDANVLEYTRSGWSFHGKGMWLTARGGGAGSPSPHVTGQAGAGDPPGPCMTMIGSPNYGSRSVSRDTEVEAVVVTTDEGLMQQLQEEKNALLKYSTRVTADNYPENIPWYARILAQLLKSLM
jgi:CDP-diacylglycerol--glycerol-3-phosphate 3-phosphatidyltransferase